ncbi:hypothetical protein RyT2_11410 [Pseudolactococcus yaeyamensis]
MGYLTVDEFEALGFESVSNFDNLEKKASQAIDSYINRFYSRVDFDTDVAIRKKAVKLAMSYQIDYLNRSGIFTAEDKQSMASVSIGRTSVNYASGAKTPQHNITVDAQNALSGLGFFYAGIDYD